MTATPWMKFYPRDWRGDQALRAVSIAARGLWMECLCIMHEATPYGHLLLNGNPVGDETLARMAGVPVDETRFLLDELRQAGVLSVTRKGVIFSRRMTKDHARAQKGRASADKRWKKPKPSQTQAIDTERKSSAPNGSPNRDPTTQRPEARYQKEKERAIAPAFSEDLGIRPEVERGFLDHRRKLRRPMTQRAVELLGNHLRQIRASGRDPNDALDLAVMKGWQSVNLEWVENEERRRGVSVSSADPSVARILRRVGGGG